MVRSGGLKEEEGKPTGACQGEDTCLVSQTGEGMEGGGRQEKDLKWKRNRSVGHRLPREGWGADMMKSSSELKKGGQGMG